MGSLLQKAFAKETLLACDGYIPSFVNKSSEIGFENILSATLKKNLLKVEGNKNGILNYTNLSVFYDAQRMVPFAFAYNVDGSTKSNKVVRANNFQRDPRIDLSIQLNQAFYDLQTGIIEFEIGHMH